MERIYDVLNGGLDRARSARRVRRIADGCHLDRDTAAEIKAAGFRIQRLERFKLPAGHELLSPSNPGDRDQTRLTSAAERQLSPSK